MDGADVRARARGGGVVGEVWGELQPDFETL